ncbi:MAG: hypothetical protein WAM82_18960 [Thermoanaerobaculia bacterium]
MIEVSSESTCDEDLGRKKQVYARLEGRPFGPQTSA